MSQAHARDPSDIEDKIGVVVFPFSDKGACWETYLSLCDSKRFRFIGVSTEKLFNKRLNEDHYFISASVDDSSLSSELLYLISRTKAEILLPVHDSVMEKLKPVFKRIIPGSSNSTVKICRSKSATYSTLEKHVKVPVCYDSVELPCFIKPDRGQGSRGARLVRTIEEFDEHYRDDMVILEYLPGTEYTVDCLTDSQGRLAHCAPRERVSVEDGIAVETRFVNLPDAITATETVNDVLQMRGAWFCQFKRDNQGELTLMEVAPRIAGASGINRIELGVNLTEWMLAEHLKTA